MNSAGEVTLEELLEAREYRADHQKELIEEYKLPLISFTINIPGPIKKTTESSIIFQAGCKEVVKKLKDAGLLLEHFETNEPNSGYESYFVVKTTERTLKALMLEIESEHPLGRLFDLDVIGTDGIPISREKFGRSKRKCLVCEDEAHICSRSRKHSIEALTDKIRSMVDSYLKIGS